MTRKSKIIGTALIMPPTMPPASPIVWHTTAMLHEYERIKTIVTTALTTVPNHTTVYLQLAHSMGTLASLLNAQLSALNAPRKRKTYTRKTPATLATPVRVKASRKKGPR